MKINSPNRAKIIVELTQNDMSELDITYSALDYSNIETRRVIWTILDRARQELGRDIDPSGKLTIEALPLDHGGCVIFFTVNDVPESIKTLLSQNERVYEFESADNVFDLVSALESRIPLGDLYADGKGKFRLISRGDEPALSKVKIGEYSRHCPERLAAEITKEHWHLKSTDFGAVSQQ